MIPHTLAVLTFMTLVHFSCIRGLLLDCWLTVKKLSSPVSSSSATSILNTLSSPSSYVTLAISDILARFNINDTRYCATARELHSVKLPKAHLVLYWRLSDFISCYRDLDALNYYNFVRFNDVANYYYYYYYNSKWNSKTKSTPPATRWWRWTPRTLLRRWRTSKRSTTSSHMMLAHTSAHMIPWPCGICVTSCRCNKCNRITTGIWILQMKKIQHQSINNNMKMTSITEEKASQSTSI